MSKHIKLLRVILGLAGALWCLLCLAACTKATHAAPTSLKGEYYKVFCYNSDVIDVYAGSYMFSDVQTNRVVARARAVDRMENNLSILRFCEYLDAINAGDYSSAELKIREALLWWPSNVEYRAARLQLLRILKMNEEYSRELEAMLADKELTAYGKILLSLAKGASSQSANKSEWAARQVRFAEHLESVNSRTHDEHNIK